MLFRLRKNWGMEEEQQEDKNQRIKPRERARVQKRLEHISWFKKWIYFFLNYNLHDDHYRPQSPSGHPFSFLLTSFFVSSHRTHHSCQCCKLLYKWKYIIGKIDKKRSKWYKLADCFDIEHIIIQNVRKILIHGSDVFWSQATQGPRNIKVDSKLYFSNILVLGPQIWNSRSLAVKSCCV